MPTVIKRNRYPELDKLLWDIHSATVTPELAFHAYEERWGFVHEQQLSRREQALIRMLTRTVGHGIFTPAFGVIQR